MADVASAIKLPGEVDAVNVGQDLDSHGRNTHPDDLAGLQKQFRHQPGVRHAKAVKDVNEFGGVGPARRTAGACLPFDCQFPFAAPDVDLTRRLATEGTKHTRGSPE